MRAGLGLVGRENELVELDLFLSAAGSGAVAIRGDAGVGKTALVSELSARATGSGWRVLRAVGVEAEKPFTLGGLNQMVFGLRDQLAGLDAHDRDALAPVFGADPVLPPSPMTLALAVLDVLSAAARSQRILLVVDDVHWLDELSATVLSVAGRRVAEPNVRILASYRPHAGAEFSTAGWAELTLGPLDEVGAAQLVDRMALPLSAATRRAILDAAAGNPLALEELPRNADQIAAWTSALPLTDRLVTVFGGRLRQLDERVRTELLRAALDGARANSSAESRSRYVMVDVQAAIDQDLLMVDPLGDIIFRHPLVRAAVIHQAGPAERRAAHAHLAGFYGDVLVRRAAHLSEAAIVPDQSVADLLDDAARLSIRRGGAATAVDWLRRAAELSTDPARRSALRAEAAFVAAQSSRFDDAEALVDAQDGTDSVAGVLTGAYLSLYRDGDVVGTHRRLLAVCRTIDTVDDVIASRLVKLLLAITQYAADPQLWQQTDEVVDHVEGRVDAMAVLYLDAWGDLGRRGHTVRSRLAHYRDTLATLEPWEVMRLGVTAYYVDGLGDFRGTLTRLFDRERDRGAVTNAMTMLHLLVLDQVASGRWAQARESAALGIELTSMHHNELFRCQFVAYDGLRAASAGDIATARRCAAEVIAWAGPRRLGLLVGFAHRIAVLTALAEADYDAAYAAAVRLGPPGQFPPYAQQAVDSVLDLVEAATHSGHLAEARAHAAAAVALHLGDISPRMGMLTCAAQALTADDARAGALYESALQNPAAPEFPFEQNRIRLAYGMWLRRQRRHTDAREVLALAADAFDALPAHPWAQRARTELRAAGAGVKRSGADTVALSAQERTIAELAAAGQSNKQIAAQLYLSPRTVGAHLYRIFPKLGVTSRAALGEALRALAGD